MSASQYNPAAVKAEAIEKILAHPGYSEVGVQAYGDWVILWMQSPDDKGGIPIVWSGISCTSAMALGEAVARAGHAAESHDEVYGKKSIVIEQIRARLVISIEHMLKSADMHGELVPDKLNLIANRCVELALTELGT